VSFHIQKLRAPIIIKPKKLGHRGIGEPATITAGCVISRINCAIAIRPNTMLATRNPVICDLIFFSLDMGHRAIGLIRLIGFLYEDAKSCVSTSPISLISPISPISPIKNGANVIPVIFARGVSSPLESQAVVALHLRGAHTKPDQALPTNTNSTPQLGVDI
jgi:hypothetical protein